ncbi:MAG: hypothetical protein JO210_14905 [Acidobacteriaceae bacterium]|nr:hypothetical protein [Acidobacteriaceae bacterium]
MLNGKKLLCEKPFPIRYLFLLIVAFGPLPLTAMQQEGVAPPSPVVRRIAAAQKKVQTNPSAQSYNDLAFALCRLARDKGDPALYEQANSALQHSLQLSPDNYDAEKLQVTVLLGQHEVAQALKLATALNQRTHDDIGGWGLLVDANIAAGNTPEAERDAQWILDLRPGSSLGFEKAAGLREIFGDTEGSIEFLEEAERRTSQNDADGRAWLLTQEARLQIKAGNRKRAGELLDEALKLFPDSQLALSELAKLRTSEGSPPAPVAQRVAR